MDEQSQLCPRNSHTTQIWLAAVGNLRFSMPYQLACWGGLIGLGGAEFRLPVLVGVLSYPVRQSIPLNLAISLVTIVTSLAIWGNTLSFSLIGSFLPAIISLIAGAVVTAFFGATLAAKLAHEQLERAIFVLLVLIGCALIIEGFLLEQIPALLPARLPWWILFGVIFGLVIGLVSSLLGVAGGEVIISTLVFAFGADIKTAGTASLLISLPTVVVGLCKYISQKAFLERALNQTVVPMSLGSVIGAMVAMCGAHTTYPYGEASYVNAFA